MLHIPFLDRTAIAVVLALSVVLALAPAAIARSESGGRVHDGGGVPPEPPAPPVPPAPPAIPPLPEVPQLPKVPQPPTVPDLPGLPGAGGTEGGLLSGFRMAPRLMLSARPRGDRILPLRFRLDGWLMPPMRLGRVAAFFRRTFGVDIPVCSGPLTIAFKANGRTVARRRASVTHTCTFRSRVAIHSRRHLGSVRRLRATARFDGNDLLRPVQHSLTLQIGQR
jgi:hypothetical protein